MLETISDAFECLLWLCEEKETLSKNEKEKKGENRGREIGVESESERDREGGMEVMTVK